MDLTKLKIVYLHSTEIMIDNILWGLLEMGLHVDNPPIQILLQEYEESDIEEMMPYLTGYDCVITQNFSASVAEAAHRKNLTYISWVYDAPQRALYMKEAKYLTNYIFSFDRMQMERVKKAGVQNIYYCPMAANVRKASLVKLDEEIKPEYCGQISFVGKLYYKDYMEQLQAAGDEIRDEMNRYYQYIDRLALKWDGSSIYGKMDDAVYRFMSQFINHSSFEAYNMDMRFGCESLVTVPFLAQVERVRVLTELSRYHDVHLFTTHPEKVSDLGNTIIHGPVDHNTDAYRVFHHSKMNLNLTMRGIETGVPMRVFDIMSAGGFVMSNYQSEAEILFEPDKEIVLFKDMDELKDKANYYLSHEKERLQIALGGFKRVLQQYNYPNLLSFIFHEVYG